MTLDTILTELRSARDRLHRAIAALEGTAPRRGRAPKEAAVRTVRRRRRMSAEARRKVSEGMRRSWAARRTSAPAKYGHRPTVRARLPARRPCASRFASPIRGDPESVAGQPHPGDGSERLFLPVRNPHRGPKSQMSRFTRLQNQRAAIGICGLPGSLSE
jgi:hypothetical protein